MTKILLIKERVDYIMLKKIIKLLSLISLTLLVSCNNKLDKLDDLSNLNFPLLNQDSIHTNFPNLIKGKIAVVGYIFTSCPDICPLTTNNMRLIREKLKSENIPNVEFVSISFDPDVDKPSVLKKFAELHEVNFKDWDFLTGKKNIIDDLIKQVGVIAVVGDSVKNADGSWTYFYVHTDRIQLIDQEGRIRKNYPGSKANIDKIVDDIKSLE